METITSEYTVTPITVKTNYDFIKSKDIILSEIGFTEYLVPTNTRYGMMNVFVNDGMIGVSLRHYGEYGQHEINLLNNVINHETVVYDIGSNVGFHTLGFSERAKHVYAFEPNNKNYKLCKLNTQTCNNVDVYNVACSNTNTLGYIEDIDLSVADNYGEVHVSDSGQECKFVKLDDFIAQEKLLPPQVMKIDVEGHEYEMLMGADHTIRNNLPIIFYEHQHGDHLPDIYDYLTGLGYTIYWFPCANYNPQNFKRQTENIFYPNSGVVNAFAVPFHVDLKTNLPLKESRTQTYNEAVDKLIQQNAKH